ncbi:hypothetical protein LTR64_000007 [Lithohypha guttulata]|uniref:uncharacterized protein n=1 Tax=Lithohypha guttulata TaxID=1690604 RepID=UPI002DDFDEA6|nr:hypothetical protein LTR51_007369 [Lithohypha guttulata]
MTSLSTKLAQLEASGKPIQVGIIGAGKFGSMYISQAHLTKGVRLAAIADLSRERALASLKRTGFPEDKYDVSLSLREGLEAGKTAITTDSAELIAQPGIDVILEVTGSPAAGVRHVLLCCEHKKHIVMVNVEADVLAGPLLARKAQEAGIIYSMAYGDQPALIAEMVDWARAAGFNVVCAGKGTKHLPEYHYSTPDTVWSHYGFTDEQLASGDFNKQMFNSFLDGTKSALEMSAVANGCGLRPPNGLKFPPCGTHDLPQVLKPKSEGGQMESYGTVEVVSCLETDGRWVHNDLRWGVYVVIEAKRDLMVGEKLDGEGGFMVYGKIMSAENSLEIEGLPIGLAHGLILKRAVRKDQGLSWQDVEWSVESQAVAVRREMEDVYRKEFAGRVNGKANSKVDSKLVDGASVVVNGH